MQDMHQRTTGLAAHQVLLQNVTFTGSPRTLDMVLKFKNSGYVSNSRGNIHVLTSTDGKAWTEPTLPGSSGGGNQGIAVSDTYAALYATPSDIAGMAIYHSTDLTNWTKYEGANVGALANSMKFTQGRWVYRSSKFICISEDEHLFQIILKFPSLLVASNP